MPENDCGEPSYLTKLPLLRTVVSRAGEPEWISLLADDDPYVYGGQKWARPEPVKGHKHSSLAHLKASD